MSAPTATPSNCRPTGARGRCGTGNPATSTPPREPVSLGPGRLDLDRCRPRPGDPPAADAAGVGVREARQDPERPPHRVLGDAHRTRSLGAHPARLRRASRRAVPRSPSTTGHFPYTFGGWREEPPDPDLECEYSARFDLDCYNRIQEEHAWQLYEDWTSDDFPRMLGGGGPAPQSLLRRFLRGELRESGPLRRRHHLRTRSRDRTPLPRTRRGVVALPLRRLHRGLGVHGRAGALPPTTTTGHGSPVRTPSISGRSRWSTSTRTKTPTTSTAPSSGPPGPGGGTGRGTLRRRSRR